MSSKVVWLDRGWQPHYYGFCPDEAAWKREVKRLGSPNEPYPETDGNCSHFVKSDKAKHCSIVVINKRFDEKHKTDPAGVAGLIVHEAVHVFQEVRRQMGDRDEPPSEEFEAYSLQAIAGGLYEAYLNTRIRKPPTKAKPRTKRRSRK